MLIAICFALLFFLEAVRRERMQTLVLVHQHRLFALRDELRGHAMERPALVRNWVFQYLDSTITRSIGLLPKMSVWHMLAAYLALRHNPRLTSLEKHLEMAYAKPENDELKKVHEKLSETISKFVFSRHFLLIFVSAVTVITPMAIATAISTMRKRSVELVLETPITSTLDQFCPQT